MLEWLKPQTADRDTTPPPKPKLRWPWQPGSEPVSPHPDPNYGGRPLDPVGAVDDAYHHPVMALAALFMDFLVSYAVEHGLPRESIGASGYEQTASMNLTLGGVTFRVSIYEENSWFAYRNADPEYQRLKQLAEKAEGPKRELAAQITEAWEKVRRRSEELQTVFEKPPARP